MSARKLLVWHRLDNGYYAGSRKSAREYVITRDNRAVPHAPKKRTYTAWVRAFPLGGMVEIDWALRAKDAKALCEKWEGRI
jgi:hypothetical protein